MSLQLYKYFYIAPYHGIQWQCEWCTAPCYNDGAAHHCTNCTEPFLSFPFIVGWFRQSRELSGALWFINDEECRCDATPSPPPLPPLPPPPTQPKQKRFECKMHKKEANKRKITGFLRLIQSLGRWLLFFSLVWIICWLWCFLLVHSGKFAKCIGPRAISNTISIKQFFSFGKQLTERSETNRRRKKTFGGKTVGPAQVNATNCCVSCRTKWPALNWHT